MPLTPDELAKVTNALDQLEHIRSWFHEAPIDEIEAVEKAIGWNAPIVEVDVAINELWRLAPNT